MIFSLVAMTGLEKCCITSAYLQWLCPSGERPVARGPLVFFAMACAIYSSKGAFFFSTTMCVCVCLFFWLLHKNMYSMGTHNICFCGDKRKISTWIFLSYAILFLWFWNYTLSSFITRSSCWGEIVVPYWQWFLLLLNIFTNFLSLWNVGLIWFPFTLLKEKLANIWNSPLRCCKLMQQQKRPGYGLCLVIQFYFVRYNSLG